MILNVLPRTDEPDVESACAFEPFARFYITFVPLFDTLLKEYQVDTQKPIEVYP
jgi:hypothetical protein